MTPPEPSAPPAPVSPTASGPGLRAAAVLGVLWQALSFLGGKVLVLAATVVLARVLTPEEFGLVAFALVVITIVDVVADGGTAQALVYLPTSRRRTDAALATALVFSGSLAAVAVLLAPVVADFFGSPEVTPILRVLSVALVLGATASVPEALLRKELQFRRTLAANLGKAGTAGVVSVALAFAGAGAWALVWGQLAGLLVFNVVAWSLVDHRPDLRFWRLSWSDSAPLVKYGASVASAMLLSKVIFDADYVVVGRMLGTEALGLYTLAFRLPELAIISVFFVVSAVAFPVYSRTGGDLVRLRRGYLSAMRLQSAYGAGAAVGLAVLAPYVVLAVFGRQWTESIVPLSALALYAGARALGAGANDVYKALGRPGLALGLAVVRLALLVPALVWAARWGIEGVAWAQAAMALLFVLLMQGLAARVLGIRYRTVLHALLPALVVGAGVALGAGAVRLSTDGTWTGLSAGLVAGLAGGLLALRLAQPAFLTELRGMLLRRASGAAR